MDVAPIWIPEGLDQVIHRNPWNSQLISGAPQRGSAQKPLGHPQGCELVHKVIVSDER
jgi:hypothetical protein